MSQAQISADETSSSRKRMVGIKEKLKLVRIKEKLKLDRSATSAKAAI